MNNLSDNEILELVKLMNLREEMARKKDLKFNAITSLVWTLLSIVIVFTLTFWGVLLLIYPILMIGEYGLRARYYKDHKVKVERYIQLIELKLKKGKDTKIKEVVNKLTNEKENLVPELLSKGEYKKGIFKILKK